MKKRKAQKRYPASVRESVLERMRLGVNQSELARQLGVDRTTLYLWKRKMQRRGTPDKPVAQPEDAIDERDYRIRELQSQVAGLEGELGRAEVEKRFFEAALRRVEGSRPKKEDSGGTASSPRSATGRTRKAE